MNKLFTKIAALALGMTMAIGVGVAVGTSTKSAEQVSAAGKITDYTNIESGSKYYIGATTGGTDYYLSVDGSNLTQSIAGTAVTSTSNATVFTFSGSGTSWSIKFESGYYLSLKSTKENGKVQVVNSASNFTASNQSSKIRLSIGDFSVQKNNSGTQFGSYGNTQTDVWLEAASGGVISVTGVSLNKDSTSIEVGSNETLTATVSPSDATNKGVTWSTSNASVATVSNGTVHGEAAGSATITVTTNDGGFTDTCDVTVTTPVVKQFSKITDANGLKDGESYLIANSGGTIVMAGQGNSNRSQVTTTLSSGKITYSSNMEMFTLGKDGTNWTFHAEKLNTGYLYASSSSNNQLKTQATVNDNARWAITFNDEVPSIVAQGTNTRNVMQHNSSSSLFACYGSASQNPVSLWKEVKPITSYSIKYDLNTGTGTAPTDDTSYTASTITKVDLQATDGMSKTGYSCDGWATSPTGQKVYNSAQKGVTDLKAIGDENEGVITLYAHWVINSYNVSFNMQEHGSAISGQSIQYGGKVNKPDDPTDSAYDFGGWYKESTCETPWNFDTDTVPDHDIELFASWTIKHHSVTFNVQGHGSAPAQQTIDHGGKVTKPDDPTAEGFEFEGWYKESTCENPWNFNTDTVTADTVLYANWVATVTLYKVTDSLTDASLSSTEDVAEHVALSLTITADTHYTLPANITVTMGGNAFSNYTYTRAPGNRSATFSIASGVIEGDLVFSGSAVRDDKYTVTYTAGTNGTGSYTHDVDYYEGETHNLLAFNALEGVSANTGYQFKDYTVGGQTKSPNDPITIGNSNVQVTVNFEIKPQEVTVSTSIADYADNNNWSNGTQYLSISLDSNITITAAGGGNTGKYYESGENWRLYQGEEATVTFESTNGAKIKTIKIGYTVDKTGVLLDENENQIASGTPVSVGNVTSYTFSVGNSGSATNGQVRITNIEVVYLGGSAPVTTYTVTYDSNGGTETMVDPNSPYNAGATVTTLENAFIRTGYTFEHWNTQSDDKGTSYSENEDFTINSNVTLYAIWKENGGGSDIAARCYTLVTDADDLVEGAKYIIGSSSDFNVALSTTQNTNNRGEEDIAITNSVASVTTDGVQIITFEKVENSNNWNINVGNGYLYAAGGSGSKPSNSLKTETNPDSDGNADFAISFDETDGNASIVAQGTAVRDTIRYNSTNTLFSCYGSGQQDVFIYRLNFEETLLKNVTCDGAGSHTLPDNYTWNTDLKGVYDDLPSAEKTALLTRSNEGLARYDYIIKKYNPTGKTQDTDYLNFIGRTIPKDGARIIVDTVFGENSNALVIVIIVSTISLSAIGGYFFLRKRREEN